MTTSSLDPPGLPIPTVLVTVFGHPSSRNNPPRTLCARRDRTNTHGDKSSMVVIL